MTRDPTRPSLFDLAHVPIDREPEPAVRHDGPQSSVNAAKVAARGLGSNIARVRAVFFVLDGQPAKSLPACEVVKQLTGLTKTQVTSTLDALRTSVPPRATRRKNPGECGCPGKACNLWTLTGQS